MKYSPPDTKGVGYLISFAIGAALVTFSLWVFRFLYYWKKHESAVVAYQSLPSFHFRKMWCAGATCGLLWSVGNFFSLFSVYYLYVCRVRWILDDAGFMCAKMAYSQFVVFAGERVSVIRSSKPVY